MNASPYNQSFFDTIRSDKSTGALLEEYLEKGIDFFTDNEVLKEIPLIKTIATCFSISNTISGARLYKKIVNFLWEIENCSEAEKDNFIRKIESDEKYKHRFGEQLLVAIDRFDEIEKATILGKAFKKFVRDEITLSMFFRVSNILNQAYLPDLKDFAHLETGLGFDVQDYWLSLGLLKRQSFAIQDKMPMSEVRSKLNSIQYMPNETGEVFIKLLTEN